jgi:pimeloyl-ACP methyl ester carboxylesterase
MYTPLTDVDRFVEPLLEPGALTGALNWYRAIAPDDLAAVGPVTVPTTYVWGVADLAVGRRAAEDCGNHVTADYRFAPLDGISHWVPEQEPQTVARLVLERVRSR